MMKLALSPLLMVLACVVAGLFGMFHNQISYTVSSEYFHDLKFLQFQIPRHHQDRWGAALVGWYASWWLGFLISIPIVAVGCSLLSEVKAFLIHTILSFCVVALTALTVGLTGLVYAWLTSTPETTAFALARTMHNFSYLGGGLGIVTASIYLFSIRYRLHRRH